MTAVSGSPTQQSTSVATVAALESVEVDQFQSGDLAFVTETGTTYLLGAVDNSLRNGTSVLWTRNSNPAYGGDANGLSLGRWLRTNLTPGV